MRADKLWWIGIVHRIETKFVYVLFSFFVLIFSSFFILRESYFLRISQWKFSSVRNKTKQPNMYTHTHWNLATTITDEREKKWRNWIPKYFFSFFLFLIYYVKRCCVHDVVHPTWISFVYMSNKGTKSGHYSCAL